MHRVVCLHLQRRPRRHLWQQLLRLQFVLVPVDCRLLLLLLLLLVVVVTVTVVVVAAAALLVAGAVEYDFIAQRVKVAAVCLAKVAACNSVRLYSVFDACERRRIGGVLGRVGSRGCDGQYRRAGREWRGLQPLVRRAACCRGAVRVLARLAVAPRVLVFVLA